MSFLAASLAQGRAADRRGVAIMTARRAGGKGDFGRDRLPAMQRAGIDRAPDAAHAALIRRRQASLFSIGAPTRWI
ncbi:hypothetical protein JQ557_30560 [Bradyrhizobium sp. U87765 SZCCT0131]|uniref:hypothetical protein n=1 Tax=unclassified Bradyrhizobium TaxID=2631580 RepID=UPI001BAE523D|nr:MULTISPECIES: hypothetical protein [unclassified Bradyrhizobium]MBR1222378.1 hypothetical protein [Bradyrhizobium sp. U87765 SZCCT0131]MBR1264138.1 hypothetical protein [Bradyrhizobium sp. U87765 SZCCT0134]MBR1308079.1 hypothetical protein [Bradyrhizobium sp. U87765 SZCCT0110]MBR1320388.1 hypothetical protein [Bradyrhizobium sp. U87765 SZCCT0109]MBR1348499.1 hypothetical protein [Bradyrhizobium sp. U87765 SZCCT0048]